MPRFRHVLFLPLLLLAGLLRAQSARWEPASGTLPRDQVSQLALVFEDCEPKDAPTPPKIDGLSFLGTPGRSEQSSFNLSFGAKAVRRSTIIYTFAVRPNLPDGEVRIPAFAVETDAGRLTVPPAGFHIAAATVGNSGMTLDQVARTRLAVSNPSVWAGEVFILNHVLEVNRNHQFRSSDTLAWNNQSVVAEPWGEPLRSTANSGGATSNTETRTTRALAATPGNRDIGTVSQEVVIATGVNMFGQPVGSPYSLTTDPFPLEVRPLPSPAPADFIGAVGKFTLVSKVVPEKAAVGEPVTWTLVLEGTGNWPAIDKLRPRSLSRDFRVVSPRAQKTSKPDTLFEATLTEDLVLIPQKPGRSTLGPYTLSVFNPSTGSYETLRTDTVVIEIADAAPAPALPAPGQTAPTPGVTADPVTSPAPAAPPAAPGPVAKLPADPLPPGLVATAPRAGWPHALRWTPLALLFPLALWLGLAARHARTHDRLRARRAAHEQLRRLLTRLESPAGGNPCPPPEDLLAWQHATRELFSLPSATPSSRDLPDPVWAALWIEVDRALYRPATPLAKQWFAQAWEAHARAQPPVRSAFDALRPAHLFARAALWAALLALAASFADTSLAAAPTDALAAYAKGDFPAAEAALRPAVAAAPLDAAVRHDLALSLAQQGKWDEAAAHAYAAALQRPGDASLDRLFAAVAPRAGYRIQLPPAAVRLLPVRGWQNLSLAATLALLALVPAAYLGALFAGSRRRALLATGHALLVLSLASLAAAVLALRAHGSAASADAALVWRAATLRAVPTDAGDQKVVAELPAGTLARVDKDFLGWRRIVLADGNTGWVRAEPLVPLWR